MAEETITTILVRDVDGEKMQCPIRSKLLDELPLSVLTVASEIEDGEEIDMSMGPRISGKGKTFLDDFLSACVMLKDTLSTRAVVQMMIDSDQPSDADECDDSDQSSDADEYDDWIQKIRLIATIMEWQSFLQLGTLDDEMMQVEFQEVFDLVDRLGVNGIQGKFREHIQKQSSGDAIRLLLSVGSQHNNFSYCKDGDVSRLTAKTNPEVFLRDQGWRSPIVLERCMGGKCYKGIPAHTDAPESQRCCGSNAER